MTPVIGRDNSMDGASLHTQGDSENQPLLALSNHALSGVLNERL